MAEEPKYTEQWERVNRWYVRFKNITEGKGELLNANNFQDDIFAFFLNCYHLKDWIMHDPSVTHMHNLVEPFINKSEALSICADLCNGLKHLSLNNSRSGQNPKFGPKTHRVQIGIGPTPTISIGYLIVTDTKNFDAFELAGTCMMEWFKFISLNREPLESI